MTAAFDAGLAPACLDCGTTGGYVHQDCHRPSRTRGLCQACESKHSKKGTLGLYTLTSGNHLAHPVIPAGYIGPALLGCVPGAHAVLPGYNALAVMAEAELAARRWFADAGHRAAALRWLWSQSDETAHHLMFGVRPR